MSNKSPTKVGRKARQAWLKAIAEIGSIRQTRRRDWGVVDDITIARYVRGSLKDVERMKVEEAMKGHPQLRQAIAILRLRGSQVGSDDSSGHGQSEVSSSSVVAAVGRLLALVAAGFIPVIAALSCGYTPWLGLIGVVPVGAFLWSVRHDWSALSGSLEPTSGPRPEVRRA